MITLKKNLSDFSFFEREKANGKTVANKCGRDFLYYVLNFYFPHEFNDKLNNPVKIEEQNLFGTTTHSSFAWTQIQFDNVANFLNQKDLRLTINSSEVKGYLSFVKAILFARKKYDEAVKEVEFAIAHNEAVGIDISLGVFGLLDHVLFVYGYDTDNFYVFDTHRVPLLEYEPIGVNNFYYRLPKKVAESRWTRFGRVWIVKKS
jgi:hypothetical protein